MMHCRTSLSHVCENAVNKQDHIFIKSLYLFKEYSIEKLLK